MMARRSARETCAMDDSSHSRSLSWVSRFSPGRPRLSRMPLRTDSQKLAASSSSTTKKNPPRSWTRSRIWPSRWVLPGAGLPADRDAQRGGVGVAQRVAERVHDVVDGALVEAVHVGRAWGATDRRLVGAQVRRSDASASRCASSISCSIAIRCLS